MNKPQDTSPADKTATVVPALIASLDQVEEIAGAIAAEKSFAFDLEFVSEGRYLPDLSLVQVAWGPAFEPHVAAIDCLAVDPMPVLELVASSEVEAVAHAAKQDLGILAAHFGLAARALWDTQIAAAFLGIGDQMGYAKLVSRITGTRLDKGAQYTAWLNRPLSEKQLCYALNDVRYLPRVWETLRERLVESGRLSWVEEESEELARTMESMSPDGEAYREVPGWRSLEPESRGSLRNLAEWRLRTARRRNRPLSWVLLDRAMVDLCRLGPRTLRDLKRVRGVGNGTVRRYGEEILERIQKGAASPLHVPRTKARPDLSARGQVWVSTVANLIKARCVAAKIAPRYVATRANAEALVVWFENGDRDVEPAIPLLRGWRRELAGGAALAWLEGDATISVERDGPAALRLVEW